MDSKVGGLLVVRLIEILLRTFSDALQADAVGWREIEMAFARLRLASLRVQPACEFTRDACLSLEGGSRGGAQFRRLFSKASGVSPSANRKYL